MASPPPLVDHSLDGDSKVPEIIAILGVFTALSTLMVVLRVCSRIWITGAFGADDWALVAAQVRELGSRLSTGVLVPTCSVSGG